MCSDDVAVKTPSAKLTDLNIKLAKIKRDGGSRLIDRNFFALGVNYVQRNWDLIDDGEGPTGREGEGRPDADC